MRIFLAVLLLVLAVPGPANASVMEVRPGAEIIVASAGPPGGPFSPSQVVYTVRNVGSAPIEWQATRTEAWLALSVGGGALAPGQSVTVTVSLDPGVAPTLAAGGHSDQVVFLNLTTDTFVKTSGELATGPTTRLHTLNVFRTGLSLDQGFGATTAGGATGEVFHVTTLEDNGNDDQPVPGSLREALARGHRYIVFDVAGEIALGTHLYVRGAYVTIDGLSAPPPGITLRRYGLILKGKQGAHDIVVRGFRVRDLERAPGGNTLFDGIQVFQGAFNIVIDHVSIDGADDGSIDVGGDVHDVTVSWSILARPKSGGKNMLIKYNPSRITLHHSLLVDAYGRNPLVQLGDQAGIATDTTVDMRNNVVWNFTSGTRIEKGAVGNVVGNYYSKVSGAIQVVPVRNAYVAGNRSADGRNVGRTGAPTPFSAPAVETTTAEQAACQVLAGAGVRPLDAVDAQRLSTLRVPGCSPGGLTTVRLTGPAAEAPVAGAATLAATITGDVRAVQFFLDGLALGPELTQPPFTLAWDTTSVPDGAHALHARARDANGVVTVSPGVPLTVRNH